MRRRVARVGLLKDGRVLVGGDRPLLVAIPTAVFAAFAATGSRLVAVKVVLIQRERLPDPQPGAPEHDDKARQADRVVVELSG